MNMQQKNSEVRAAAALWQIRCHDGLSADEEAQFQQWLAAEASHAEAWTRAAGTWQGLAQLHPSAVAQLRRGAQPARAPANAAADNWLTGLTGSLMRPIAGAAAAVVILGAGWLGWSQWQQQPVFSQHYASARGQQLDVYLPDGSVLKLDTDTRAQVTLYRNRREVRLPEGQAMFTVKADAGKPFQVLTDRLQVTVVGTRFAVRNTHEVQDGQEQSTDSVAVEEGKVRVSRLSHGEATGQPLLLTAGQALRAEPAGQLQMLAAIPARSALLWREGRVNFDKTPLPQALAEFERYGATHLVINDPAVARMRVNGSFDLRQVTAFSQTLPLVLPVQLRQQGGEMEIAIRK